MSLLDGIHVKRTEERLWGLVDQRLVQGADIRAVDGRIWELFGDRAAVLCTHLAGVERQISAYGVVHLIRILRERDRLLLPLVAQYDGVFVVDERYGLQCTFRTMARAQACAQAMVERCREENNRREAEDQILLCVGLGFGDLIRVGDTRAWGLELDAARTLCERHASAFEIMVTEGAKAALGDDAVNRLVALDVAVPGSAENYRLQP